LLLWACSQKLWISYNLLFRCYNLHVLQNCFYKSFVSMTK
jgi:hypothetical protein